MLRGKALNPLPSPPPMDQIYAILNFLHNKQQHVYCHEPSVLGLQFSQLNDLLGTKFSRFSPKF